MRRALERLGFWIQHSPIPEQVRMVRPSPLPVRWAFFKHDSERSFEQVRSLAIRRLLTQRFRYFVVINEAAKATAGPLPDGQGVPDVTLDWLLRAIPDRGPSIVRRARWWATEGIPERVRYHWARKNPWVRARQLDTERAYWRAQVDPDDACTPAD